MEAPTTTQLFAFVDGQQSFSHERVELFLPTFERLRRSLYRLILGLSESGEHDEEAVARRLRNTFSEWLTAPLVFDGSLAFQLAELGDSAAVADRWGAELQSHHDSALSLASTLQGIENPMRETFCRTVRELMNNGLAFKIYCNRQDEMRCRNALSTIGINLAEDDPFIRSAAEYRKAGLFDALIKMGPLRSKGWGHAPHSIKSAPRFRRLIQIVWGGLKDEADFGYDPVASGFGDSVIPAFITWQTTQTRAGEFVESSSNVRVVYEDELDLLSKLAQEKLGQPRRCLKFGVADELSISFPFGVALLAINPGDTSLTAIDYLRARDLQIGFYLIRHVFTEDIDLGAPACDHGYFSLTWKKRLQDARATDLDGLIKKLRANGVGLEHLGAALRNWCKPAGAVIPAPQQMRHFRILMRVLDLVEENEVGPGALWRKAWAEISRSRGNASEAGRQREDIVDAELVAAARDAGPQIRALCDEGTDFSYPIPQGRGLLGHFLCSRINSVEAPFLVPQNEIGKTLPNLEFEQWRA